MVHRSRDTLPQHPTASARERFHPEPALNVATAHFAGALAADAIDPWEAMFEAASQQRPADATDIVPYWIYTVEGGAHIERRVLAHPLSRDVTRLHELLKSLTLYRARVAASAAIKRARRT